MKEYSISKKAWVEIALASAIFVGLAAVAAFYDLAINKALYNPDSLFGQFFARLGELPSYLAAPTVGAILFHQNYGEKKALAFFPKLLFAALVFVGWFFCLYAWVWGNFIDPELPYKLVYQLFFSAFLTVAVLLATSLADKKAMKKLLLFALFVLIVAGVSNAIIQVMKEVWSRQRFRTMVDNEMNSSLIAAYGRDFAGFAPWYKPQALFPSSIRDEAYIAAHKAIDSDTFRSFPSGHTVAASASYAIIILPIMYEKLKKLDTLFWIVPTVYTATVAISRIVMGAHYLSDVLFGGYIGLAVAALTRYIIVKKRSKAA